MQHSLFDCTRKCFCRSLFLLNLSGHRWEGNNSKAVYAENFEKQPSSSIEFLTRASTLLTIVTMQNHWSWTWPPCHNTKEPISLNFTPKDTPKSIPKSYTFDFNVEDRSLCLSSANEAFCMHGDPPISFFHWWEPFNIASSTQNGKRLWTLVSEYWIRIQIEKEPALFYNSGS